MRNHSQHGAQVHKRKMNKIPWKKTHLSFFFFPKKVHIRPSEKSAKNTFRYNERARKPNKTGAHSNITWEGLDWKWNQPDASSETRTSHLNFFPYQMLFSPTRTIFSPLKAVIWISGDFEWLSSSFLKLFLLFLKL